MKKMEHKKIGQVGGETKKMIGQVRPGKKQDLEERTTIKKVGYSKHRAVGMWERETWRDKFVGQYLDH